MTITIVAPVSGDPFGPGFKVDFSTDTVGPFEPGTVWVLKLTAPANEEQLASRFLGFSTNHVESVFLSYSNEIPIPVLAQPQWRTGEPGQLRIELVEPSSGVIEATDVAIELDRQTGSPVELMNYIDYKLQVQPVGLTTDQGQQLNRVEAGMAIGMGVLPVDLIGGLADGLINGPGLSVGSLSGAYTLTGDGEMPDIATSFRTRLGIYFVATTIPAGLGHRHGQSEEYPSRLVQWRTIHTVGGVELVTEVQDFITHGEIWRWRDAKPTRIEYSILPGVVISARWHWWP